MMSETKPKIVLENRHFFPGNIVSGSIQQCQSQNVQLIFFCEMFQQWTWTSSNSDGSSTTHWSTKTTPIITPKIIPVDASTGRFQFQLDYGYVPSINAKDNCRIHYFLKATDSSSGASSESEPAPVVILSPLQAKQWAADTSRSETRVTDVVQCCCCSQGKVTTNCFISKTAIALDRDQLITLQVEIDCTQSDIGFDDMYVYLQARGRTKVGHIGEFVDEVGKTRIPANVKAGEKKIVEATISPKPNAAPSLSSAIVDIDYFIKGLIQTINCFSEILSSEFTFPVFVGSTVTDCAVVEFQQHWQNKTVFDPNADHATPVMYQPPKDQEPLQTLPPESFGQQQDSSSGNNVEETHL